MADTDKPSHDELESTRISPSSTVDVDVTDSAGDFGATRRRWEEAGKTRTPTGVRPARMNPKTPSVGGINSCSGNVSLPRSASTEGPTTVPAISSTVVGMSEDEVGQPQESVENVGDVVVPSSFSSKLGDSSLSGSFPTLSVRDVVDRQENSDGRMISTNKTEYESVATRTTPEATYAPCSEHASTKENSPTTQYDGDQELQDDYILHLHHSSHPNENDVGTLQNHGFDIMKDYWEEVAKEKTLDGVSSDKLQDSYFANLIVHPDADRIMAMEDTDNKPCATYPELDEEIDDDDEFPQIEDFADDEESSKNDRGTQLDGTSAKDHVDLSSTRHGYEYAGSDSTCVSSVSDKVGSELHLRDSPHHELYASIEVPVDAAPLPDPASARACGSVLTRTSLRTLVLKKWQRTFWVQYGPTSLYIFRSRDDFEDWLHNPYHTQKQRDYLIKLRVDFYDDLSRKSVRGYKMTPIKVKAYEKKGPHVHQFKLERWTDLGVSIVAAFASSDPDELESLRTVIEGCMEKCPDNGLRSIDDLLVK